MSPCAAPGLVSGRALGGRPGGRRERPPHRVHPHFLAHLAADMAQALDAVDAHGLEAAVAQHAHHLRVLCAGAQSASLAPLRAASLARNSAGLQRDAPWPSSLKMSSRFSSLSFLPAAASALVAGRIHAALAACTARRPSAATQTTPGLTSAPVLASLSCAQAAAARERNPWTQRPNAHGGG
jgi:hypothetical protein